MKIVIVEDELIIRHGIKNLLGKMSSDYQVLGDAENGLDGLKLIRDIVPDLVITDVKMPQMSGLKMMEEVRALGLSPKFIILSGFAEFKFAQRALQLGAVQYLLKPISISELKTAMEQISNNGKKAIPEEREKYLGPVEDMVKTIESDYGQRIGLDVFAEKYKITTEHLSRLFTKATGRTFSDYIKEIRLEHAKDFLCNTDMKIYEIACRVGYPDAKYFSKVFKEYTGFSAKHYNLSIAEQR